jgi:GNAT superfamily N-acetyltransferase
MNAPWTPTDATRRAGTTRRGFPATASAAALVAHAVAWLTNEALVAPVPLGARRSIALCLTPGPLPGRKVGRWVAAVQAAPHRAINTPPFYLELHAATTQLPALQGRRVASLRLFALHVPPAYRRQGVASSVLDALQALARQHCRLLLVGPVLDPRLAQLLHARGTFYVHTVLDAFYWDPEMRVTCVPTPIGPRPAETAAAAVVAAALSVV